MITNKAIGYDLPELKEKSGVECAQLLYEVAVRGEEIEQQVKEFLASEYSLVSDYYHGKWWIADRRESHHGVAICNPDAEYGGFPDLTSLLKWCVRNRSE